MHDSEGESSSTHHRNAHVQARSWVTLRLLSQAMGIRLAKLCHMPRNKTQAGRSNSTKSQKLKLQGRDEQKEVSSKKPPSQISNSSSHVQRRSQEEKSTTSCMEEAVLDQVRMIGAVKGKSESNNP